LITIFVIIWIVLKVLDSGAAFLLAIDLFRAHTRIAQYWAVALIAITLNSLGLVLAIVLIRSGASPTSQLIGLAIILLLQGFKTATVGALALYMRGNLGNSEPKQTTEEQNQ
jgi:hypothetical protein